MSNELLLPCPFCGKPGLGLWNSDGDNSDVVYGCDSCQAVVNSSKLWNTRPTEAAIRTTLVAEIKKSEAELKSASDYAQIQRNIANEYRDDWLKCMRAARDERSRVLKLVDEWIAKAAHIEEEYILDSVADLRSAIENASP